MDLYYGLTVYHVLVSVIHKLACNPDAESELYISHAVKHDPRFLERLRKTGLFSSVQMFNDGQFWPNYNNPNYTGAKENLRAVLDKVTDVIFSQLNAPIDKYENLYIIADHFPLGFCLAHKGIPYYYFEEASGAHYKRDIALSLFKKNNPLVYEIYQQTGVRGACACTIANYYDFDSQSDSFVDEKGVDFSASKMLAAMPAESLEMIKYIFCANKKISLDKANTAIIFTQHFSATGRVKLDGLRLLYSYLIDFFCEDMNLLIKPHPDDRQGLYTEWFHNCSIVDRYMPSEILPYYLDGRIDYALTATSAAILNIGDLAGERIHFLSDNNGFESTFSYMPRYFVATALLQCMAFENGFSVYGLGADMEQVRNLLQYTLRFDMSQITNIRSFDHCQLPTQEERRVIFVDNIETLKGQPHRNIIKLLHDLKEDDLVFFINTQDDVVFYDPANTELMEHIVPIPIDRIPQNGKLERRAKNREWIYAMSKNNETKKVLLSERIERLLSHTGVELVAGAETMTIRETYLAGMLNATEQKCLKLFLENKDLRKK